MSLAYMLYYNSVSTNRPYNPALSNQFLKAGINIEGLNEFQTAK